LFDTLDTIKDCLKAYADMVPAIVAKRQSMRDAALKGFATATDLADYLVNKDIAFRDAHEVVGKTVAYCIENNKSLEALSLAELQEFSEVIEADVFDFISLEGSVNARDHIGGTAPSQVKAAISRARAEIG
jgi:argininosuccinate lyase